MQSTIYSLFRVWEKKGSPRFIAYYNFPPSTHPLTGNKQWGGTRIEYTGEMSNKVAKKPIIVCILLHKPSRERLKKILLIQNSNLLIQNGNKPSSLFITKSTSLFTAKSTSLFGAVY